MSTQRPTSSGVPAAISVKPCCLFLIQPWPVGPSQCNRVLPFGAVSFCKHRKASVVFKDHAANLIQPVMPVFPQGGVNLVLGYALAAHCCVKVFTV